MEPTRSSPHATALIDARHPLWARGFRPFFLGAMLYGALLVPLWIAMWLGALPPPRWLSPIWWHGHEMLFGMVAAGIAGFLTTAAPVWSGRPALDRRPLLALAALWAAGRVAMLTSAWLPIALVAAIDVAFLPALAVHLARLLWGSAYRRHHGIVLIVTALAFANAVVHAEALGLLAGWASRAMRFAVDGLVVLIVVIGGRITPAFTANALRASGSAAVVRDGAWGRRVALVAVPLFAVLECVAPASPVSRVAACVAGLAVAARMVGWQTAWTFRDPLLWSLHAGMAWVVAGLLAVGLGVPGTAGLHALTAGAAGAMLVAVMPRVTLGHTGRPLVLPRGAVGALVLVHAGAIARVLAALGTPLGMPLLLLATVLWAGAFGLLAAVCAPMLLRPRVDGRPG